MDPASLLQPPAATIFDAVSSTLSAAVYMIVALAALARSPRDPRVRVFLVVAAAGVAPYCMTALIWAHGAQALTRPMVLLVALSLMVGSLALLHFAQVFPWRRPWIRRHRGWLWAGYAAVVVLTATASTFLPTVDISDSGGIGAVSAEVAETLVLLIVVVGIPLLLLLGVAVPFGGLLSLYKSYVEAGARGLHAARTTTLWMLISQLGGGVLTILVIPLLRLVAAGGILVNAAAALLFGCSLLMPLAFAYGVWRLRALDLDPELLPR